ncbi:sulfatase-like hydrolase/transferase [Labedella endophytica]|uniref:Sulfatase n=1 Tax=Labedella endophytica TaxID=1523160 RepID=A0A3S0VUG7_9MICO|nr:sulfatase-like hydrolase/transferase [Labedella endophytica]RUR01801.1 sulfatase [Labedella endophytica]
MRAIMVMFDTLNRGFLPPYGAEGVHAPNFERLAERSVTFDTCYAGSMPCMPARREMHTGRYNFLHRSWGPLEPFDDSVPELLSHAGVYTHLVTDHQHYWEDGGATYHSRYDTFEFFRGQEGDRWKGHVGDPDPVETVSRRTGAIVRQDRINRQYYPTAQTHPQTLTVDAGIEFLRTNSGEDSWFLQIECFDPHEPFVSYPEHRRWYRSEDDAPTMDEGAYDWPDYGRVGESDAEIAHMREQYSSLLTMCDESLGRVLDEMDAQGLWDDTLLIVCTDHGLLLGERGWWGKNVQPWFEENIHTPLFIWDPRSGRAGERSDALVQTIDFGATLLDYFGLPLPADMLGSAIGPLLAEGVRPREVGLFGSFGGHVNVTDGRYVYMRACATPENGPLYEHTLMPTHMASRFRPEELREAELIPPLAFSKQVPVLRMPAAAWGDPWSFGTLLFDLLEDPDQLHPLVDPELERRMVGMLVTAMVEADAPPSQFERLGLPEHGEITDRHLLTRSQHANAREALTALPSRTTVSQRWPILLRQLGSVAEDDDRWPTVLEHLPMLSDERTARMYAGASVYELAQMFPSLGATALAALGDALTAE